eukprot:8599970-Pyramimonas_sp.AAC.1
MSRPDRNRCRSVGHLGPLGKTKRDRSGRAGQRHRRRTWAHGQAVGEAGTPDEVLQQLWDSVLQGIDYEIAGRHDK